jgi:hypothetical protein
MERELIKLAFLADALATGLRQRGVPTAKCALAAETGMAVFRVAFAQWLADKRDRGLARTVKEAMQRMRVLAAA